MPGVRHPKLTMKATFRFAIALSVIAATSTHAAPSYLSPNPPAYGIDDRFRIEVDLAYAQYETELRLDRDLQTLGTTLSAENDLGLDDAALLLQFELTLLPGKHHMVRLHGLSMRRDGYAVVSRPIRFKESVYAVGQRVDSNLDISMVGLTYGWLPLRTDRYELGLTLGVQIASVDANVEVRAVSPREPESGVAPLPLLGVEGRYEFTRRWSVDGRFQYISGYAKDIDASLNDSRLAIRWRQNQHLLYGIGYRRFQLDVESLRPSKSGKVHLGISGPMLFIQGSL